MYIQFDRYLDLGGTVLTDIQFDRYAFRAKALIDSVTHCRIRDEQPVRQAAEYAAFALIEAMVSADAISVDGRDAQAISNDGVSVTFSTGKSASARYADIVREYLGGETTSDGVPLTYSGVDV